MITSQLWWFIISQNYRLIDIFFYRQRHFLYYCLIKFDKQFFVSIILGGVLGNKNDLINDIKIVLESIMRYVRESILIFAIISHFRIALRLFREFSVEFSSL